MLVWRHVLGCGEWAGSCCICGVTITMTIAIGSITTSILFIIMSSNIINIIIIIVITITFTLAIAKRGSIMGHARRGGIMRWGRTRRRRWQRIVRRLLRHAAWARMTRTLLRAWWGGLLAVGWLAVRRRLRR